MDGDKHAVLDRLDELDVLIAAMQAGQEKTDMEDAAAAVRAALVKIHIPPS